MSRAQASESDSSDPEINGPADGEEDEAENWMGAGDAEIDANLMKKEAELRNNEDEFIEDIRHNQVPEAPENLSITSDDYDVVKLNCQRIAEILQDFRRLAENGRSRQSYLEEFLTGLARLYGYNMYLLEQIASLVPIAEVMDFIEANEHQRPVVIRTNTLRTRPKELMQVLKDRGVTIAPIGKWTQIGLIIFDTQVPIGATPEYLSGHYMLQSPSSFLPVMALNPQKGMRVLDMCSAPGGKTTHMAQLMGNKGVIVANDVNRARCNALIANIHRLGVVNTIVTNYDGRAFPDVLGGFDMVMIDAPCSGTGVISRDASVKTTKSEAELKVLTQNQKELILHAYDSVKTAGGRLCYCTCSLLVEENEAVVDYLLNHRPGAKCIPPGLDAEFDVELANGIKNYKEHRFRDDVANSRRVYPHRMNMDGFFFALIDVPPGRRGEPVSDDEEQKPKEAQKPTGKSKTEKRKEKRHKQQQRQKKFSKRFGGK